MSLCLQAAENEEESKEAEDDAGVDEDRGKEGNQKEAVGKTDKKDKEENPSEEGEKQ